MIPIDPCKVPGCKESRLHAYTCDLHANAYSMIWDILVYDQRLRYYLDSSMLADQILEDIADPL